MASDQVPPGVHRPVAPARLQNSTSGSPRSARQSAASRHFCANPRTNPSFAATTANATCGNTQRSAFAVRRSACPGNHGTSSRTVTSPSAHAPWRGHGPCTGSAQFRTLRTCGGARRKRSIDLTAAAKLPVCAVSCSPLATSERPIWERPSRSAACTRTRVCVWPHKMGSGHFKPRGRAA